ncbi:MAG: flagellar basal body rod protein FlgB [Anaerovoracaceae bacterium]
MSWLESNSLLLSKKTLDNLWKSQRFSLENIANQDTPQYKSKYVTFEDELKTSLARYRTSGDRKLVRSSAAAAIADSGIYVHESTAESTREDGNNVDLESEYLELARNQIQYQYAIRQISQEYSRLQKAIEG